MLFIFFIYNKKLLRLIASVYYSVICSDALSWQSDGAFASLIVATFLTHDESSFGRKIPAKFCAKETGELHAV